MPTSGDRPVDSRPPVFRFAPSPNGFLHLGHAYSALLNHRAAAASGRSMLLRIEDIDRERCRPEFEAAILEDLAWLGTSWARPVVRQSERFELYRAAIDALQMLGLLYPAFMSRAEIQTHVEAAERSGTAWPRDPNGAPLYPGNERGWPVSKREKAMTSGRSYALRLDMDRALAGLPSLSWRERTGPRNGSVSDVDARPDEWGDVIVARRDFPASYHLCVTVDDAAQGVTDIVRGKDLRAATSVHRVLQSLLGLPEPVYFHHRLILDESGRKLSKSRGSETLRARRLAGASAASIIQELGLSTGETWPRPS